MNKITRREVLKIAAGAVFVGSGISANCSSLVARSDDETSKDSMRKLIKPPKLISGDTVGIASPASAFFPINESAFQRGIAYLEKTGLHVQIAPHTRDQRKHLNPPAQHRADDLNQMFADPSIKAIFCLSGGSGVNAVLPLLDWHQIQVSPKIVMGYSAVTALLNGLYAKVGLVTFHGPMILNGFSEYPQPFAYTCHHVERILFNAEPAGKIEPPAQWTDAYTSEDQPRAMKTNSGWRWLRAGNASGPLVGGNLSVLLTLAGTPYWPVSQGAILCLEEVNFGDSQLLRNVDESLNQCQQIGVFDQIAGLIVSKVNELTEEEKNLFELLILEYTTDRQFPILSGVDFGHTAPQLTLPIGIQASLDSGRDLFSVDEGAVVSN
ncbi:MAG: LD-carboxypeptidase [Gemmatimonadota bacterium]|nr:LD-carboxypeptidase [Gemmatimonadota bacterium]